MFRTAGGSTNGLHPNLIIIDDPMDQKDRESEAVRRQKEVWYDSIHPLIVPFFCEFEGEQISIEHIMLICTRWHLNDLITKIQEMDDEFDFHSEGVYAEGYDGDGLRKLQYPELMDHKKIADLMKKMSEVFFACQYLNDPLPEGHRLFPTSKLKFMRPDQIDIDIGNNYAFLDPAKGGDKNCYPAVIFMNRKDGKNVFFDAIDDKMPLDQTISMACRLCAEYKVKMFIYETNGTTLLDSAIRRGIKENNHTCGRLGIHETRNKSERIASMQPDLIYGENYFMDDYQERYPELMKQLTLYPAYGPVDFPDIIEKAIAYMAANAPGRYTTGSDVSSKSGEAQTISGSLLKRRGW